MSVVLRSSARLLVLLLAVLGLLAAQAWSAGPARAAGAVVYDSIPASPAPSYSSVAYQASQTSEFGDLVELGGTNRIASTVTVGFVSWACQTGAWQTGDCGMTTPGATFTHPITLNIYAVGTPPALGGLLATVTDTVNVPYRPEVATALECPGAGLVTAWFDPVGGTCQNGFFFTHTWDLSSPSLTLPDRFVVSIAFNTNTYGASPIGTAGPYDSLNVAIMNATPTTGFDVDTAVMYRGFGGPPPSSLAAVTTWPDPFPQFGLSLRIDATAPAAAGGGGTRGPGLAVTGNPINPWVVGGAALAVVIGVVLAVIGFRRRPAHRA